VIRIALVAIGAVLVVAPSAASFSSAGTPWPVTRITVWNDTPYRTPLREAMASWNAVGARVTFAPAARRSTAHVVVGLLPAGATAERVGVGTVGWTAGAPGRVAVQGGLGQREASAVLAHELGHVLGLGHEQRACSVMSSPLAVARRSADCRIARCPILSRCLVQPDDAEGLRDLYERRLPALLPQRVRGAAAHPVGRSMIELAWRSPLEGPGAGVLVRAERGRCPTTPYGSPLERTGLVPLRRGASQRAALPISSGTWCAGIWVQDAATLLVGPPAYVRLTVP
jgi:hypothetical protein